MVMGQVGHGRQEEVSNIKHGPSMLSQGWGALVCCWNPSLVTDTHWV